MFSKLTRELRDQVDRTGAVLSANDRLRAVLFEPPPTASVERDEPGGAHEPVRAGIGQDCRQSLTAAIAPLPNKVDWQVYDHCAAFTRLYAAYETFVNELVTAYVNQLPDLYGTYNDLPEVVSSHHRRGIGQILLKMGPSKQYRELDEGDVVRAISSGLRTTERYALIPAAFLLEGQNYRFNVITAIFGGIGFENCGQWIVRHSRMTEFMRVTRGEEDTPQAELESFIEYRNEASHGIVENIVGTDEIERIGEFVCVLGDVLAEMIELAVAKRKIELGTSQSMGHVEEVHHRGVVAVARMSKTSVSVGDQVILYDGRTCKKTRVESLQLDNIDQQRIDAEDGQRVGIRFSTTVRHGSVLYRPVSPAEPSMQLTIEEATSEPVEEILLEAQVQDEPDTIRTEPEEPLA